VLDVTDGAKSEKAPPLARADGGYKCSSMMVQASSNVPYFLRWVPRKVTLVLAVTVFLPMCRISSSMPGY
jgi:hypothetical protein